MSQNVAQDPAFPVAQPGLSQIERVVDAYIAPTKTFTDILRSSAWWLPYLLLALFSIGVSQTVQRQVGFDRVTENRIHQSPRQEEAFNQQAPEQRARSLAIQTGVTRYISYGFFVIVLIIFALYALILWGSFNFGLGATTTYPQALAVVMYAAMPYLVRSILTIVVLYVGNNQDSFDVNNPIGTNLAYYMPDAAGWLKALLQRLDLIELWNLALVTIGMAVISRKTIAQAAVVTGILWGIMTIVAVAGGVFAG